MRVQRQVGLTHDRAAGGALPRRIGLLVLGMHRSGTSAVTRVINLLGADLPGTMIGAGPGNARGHWESEPVVAHHERLLERLGSRWDDWRRLDLAGLSAPARAEMAGTLSAIIDLEYAGSPLFVLKDPRVCRFVPLVVEPLAAAAIATSHVLVLRNPLAVAASLAERDGTAPGVATLVWLRHVLDAESATRGASRAIVSYENLLADWRAAMRAAGARLGIGWPCPIEIAGRQVDAFLSVGLQHHASTRHELVARGDIASWVKAAYDALCALERDAEDKEACASLDEVAAQFDAASPALAAVNIREHAAPSHRAGRVHDAHAADVAALRSALAERDAEIAGLRGEIAVLSAGLDECRAKIETLTGLAGARSELAAAHAQIDAFLASRSWRLTAPLRQARVLAPQFLRFAGLHCARTAIWLARLVPLSVDSKVMGARLMRLTLPTRVADAVLPAGSNLAAIAAAGQGAPVPGLLRDPLRWARAEASIPCAAAPCDAGCAELDVSVVTFNSGRCLEAFFASLLAQDYPLGSINLHATDHGSTDATLALWHRFASAHGHRFKTVSIESRPNRGFGAGHNVNLARGRADWFLVSNVDLTFEAESIAAVMASAMAAPADAAAWELRQKPYEHPKFYDFVTGETAWCSGACTLFRRSAMLQVGGFDAAIFMYCEDVELSYRLRGKGWKLTYVPKAVVWHRTYDDPRHVKPLQFLGGVYGNFFIRLRYGHFAAVARIPPMAVRLLCKPGSIEGQRAAVLRQLGALMPHLPRLIATRRPSPRFAIMDFDYEVARLGAFHTCAPTPAREAAATVSIAMRTTPGRQGWRREAVASVLAQTYPRIELVMIEDGGDTARSFVEHIRGSTSMPIVYRALPKSGRAAAGNQALALASGQYLAFLDDDDALFADHVETLVDALQARAEVELVYGHAWEVRTDVHCSEPLRYEERSYGSLTGYAQDYDAARMQEVNLIPIQAALFRRELYDRYGGFDESLDLLEDWNLWLRYSRFADFAYVPKTTSIYRVPADAEIASERHTRLQAWHERARSKALAYAPPALGIGMSR